MKKGYTQLDSIQRSQLEILLKQCKSLLEISVILNISRQTLYVSAKVRPSPKI